MDRFSTGVMRAERNTSSRSIMPTGAAVAVTPLTTLPGKECGARIQLQPPPCDPQCGPTPVKPPLGMSKESYTKTEILASPYPKMLQSRPMEIIEDRLCARCGHPKLDHLRAGCVRLKDHGPQPNGFSKKEICICHGFVEPETRRSPENLLSPSGSI